MTERERLKELLREAEAKCESTGQCRLCEQYGKGGDCQRELITAHLLANGVIVPPCKVGDTMYFDGGHFAKHRAGEIMERRVDAVLTEVWATFRGDVDLSFDFKDFGKTVFLSREEAEKAIVERSKA